MRLIQSANKFIDRLRTDAVYRSTLRNERERLTAKTKKGVQSLFSLIVIVGISYIILGPLIGIIANSFFSDADKYNPMVYLIPMEPTLERYQLATMRLDYFKVLLNSLLFSLGLMALQVMVCSMVGYGFARFDFPLKKLLFGCVIVMIVIPAHSIMLPIYMAFQSFDPLGIMGMAGAGAANLLKSPLPITIMTALGCGLRSGLYIYIFIQFFRGLPKEIEEAAYVDGCGMWYTYFRIMLINATPAVVTVAIFSLVWQYNDVFYANLFLLDVNMAISKKITTLQATITNLDKILDPSLSLLYVNAGVVLTLLPVVIVYILLQKQFIEGVERSGIVG